MYQAPHISMVVRDEDSDVKFPLERPTLFKLITEIANLGYVLKIEEDMGGNTLTVSWHEAAFPGIKAVSNSLNHFHTGYPECSSAEGEASLIKNLQQLVAQLQAGKNNA